MGGSFHCYVSSPEGSPHGQTGDFEGNKMDDELVRMVIYFKQWKIGKHAGKSDFPIPYIGFAV